jgi:malate dehydrogenase (oxaloacetate-decarboxylating)(NADP+)
MKLFRVLALVFVMMATAAGNNITIGPMLLGAAKPVHVLTASATVRAIVNMTALVVADAGAASPSSRAP